jgi:hypothetical protein
MNVRLIAGPCLLRNAFHTPDTCVRGIHGVEQRPDLNPEGSLIEGVDQGPCILEHGFGKRACDEDLVPGDPNGLCKIGLSLAGKDPFESSKKEAQINRVVFEGKMYPAMAFHPEAGFSP